MPDAKARVLLAQFPSDQTPFNVVVFGESRLPTAMMVIASNSVSLNIINPRASFTISVTDFTNNAYTSIMASDGGTTSTTLEAHDEPAFQIAIHEQNVLPERTATAVQITGGVTITPLESTPFPYFIEVHLFFGVPAHVFSQEIITTQDQQFLIPHPLGVRPNAGIWLGNTRYLDAGTHGKMNLGFHSDNGSSFKQIGMSCYYRHFQDPFKPVARVSSISRSINENPIGATDLNYCEITSITTTDIGLTVRLADIANYSICGLLFDFDVNADVSVITVPGSNATDWVYSGTGFQPQYVLMGNSAAPNVNTNYASIEASNIGATAFDEDGTLLSISGFSAHNRNSSKSIFATNGIKLNAASDTQDINFMNPTFTPLGFTVAASDYLVSSGQDVQWPTLLIEEAVSSAIVPVLSAPSDTNVGSTSSSGSVVSDVGTGTVYSVVTQSSTTPTHAQIVAGQDHLGAAADASDSVVAIAGTNNLSFAGLVKITQYFTHFTQLTASSIEAVPISASGFMTDVNQTPVFNGPMPNQTIQVGTLMTPFDTSIYFDDPDGDALTFTAVGLPNGLTINSAGIISGTPTGGFNP